MMNSLNCVKLKHLIVYLQIKLIDCWFNMLIMANLQSLNFKSNKLQLCLKTSLLIQKKTIHFKRIISYNCCIQYYRWIFIIVYNNNIMHPRTFFLVTYNFAKKYHFKNFLNKQISKWHLHRIRKSYFFL